MLKGHSASSTIMQDVLENLKLGATVVIDLSSMSLDAAYSLTSFMVDELFENNQETFVAGGRIPEVIVFVEEAQNLLSDKQVREGNPIARLAKEGRKYNLGLVYVSQQPGAIAKEILTQTNTFFALHLLSKFDIKALQDINPHYEGVIADFIQMESLQGHAYIYSTVPEMQTQSYVFATKSTSFSDTVKSLASKQGTGTSAIKRSHDEISSQLAVWLKPILASYTPTEINGERKYYCTPIAGDLSKKVSAELSKKSKDPKIEQQNLWVVFNSKRPDLVDNKWIAYACTKLNLTARIEWEEKPTRGFFLYVKDMIQQPLPIKRPA